MHITAQAKRSPNSMALIEGERSITYGELASLVEQTAGSLRAAGVSFGDQVVLLGENDVAFVTGLLAASSIGAIACPVVHRNPITVIIEQLQALSPVAMIASPDAAAEATAVIENGLFESARVGTPVGSPSTDLAPLSQGEPAKPVDLDGSESAVILHTSGIVGAPRAAVLTGRNLASAQERIIAVGQGLHVGDVALGALPFAHVLGLNVCLLPSLRVGSTIVLQPHWNADAALELIGRHGITSVVGVPPMWATWVAAAQDSASNREAMRSVSFARSGASALHPRVSDGVYDVFGLELAQGYGLTESAGTITFQPMARRYPGSVGPPLPGVEVRLVEDGREVEAGDRGEVWIRTSSIFEGYLADAAATAEVLIADGWLRTGDVGIQDDDGSLYLVGRSKDLINVSGFNVYPREVEETLETHPSVADAVVVGEPHELTGEQVVAYVTSATGDDADTDALVDHCRLHLSRYKVPTMIRMVDRLPLTAHGKRVRKELR